MADNKAIAEKHSLANGQIEDAMERLSKSLNVKVPAPVAKSHSSEERNANEAARTAEFLTQLADAADGPGGAGDGSETGAPAQPRAARGSIGDGYVESEAPKAEPEAPRPRAVAGKRAAETSEGAGDKK